MIQIIIKIIELVDGQKSIPSFLQKSQTAMYCEIFIPFVSKRPLALIGCPEQTPYLIQLEIMS